VSALTEALERPGWEYYFRADNWICVLCGVGDRLEGREDERREHFTRCVTSRYGEKAHLVVDDLRMAMFAGANIAVGTGAV